MPTATASTRGPLPALLAGLIDLAGPVRPPHSDDRPCAALCVLACTPTSEGGLDRSGDGPH